VERRRAEIAVDQIFVSDSKADYVAARDITVSDVFEALANAPRFFVRRHPESGEEQYSMLGQTHTGRWLQVAIEEMDKDEGLWRLITAYWLNSQRGLRLYQGG
jgi:hypothetical protein